MCCRYYYDQKEADRIIRELGELPHYIDDCPSGTINPGDRSLMLVGRDELIRPDLAAWGFPGRDGKLIINARAESAAERPMFKNALESRRCLLPAGCFYEWDSEKNKVTFSGLDIPVMYLAGLWGIFDNELRFVVLTTAANASMMPVHDRMPLMVPAGDIRPWLLDTSFAMACLGTEMPLLKVSREYEQMSFI